MTAPEIISPPTQPRRGWGQGCAWEGCEAPQFAEDAVVIKVRMADGSRPWVHAAHLSDGSCCVHGVDPTSCELCKLGHNQRKPIGPAVRAKWPGRCPECGAAFKPLLSFIQRGRTLGGRVAFICVEHFAGDPDEEEGGDVI